MRCSRLCGPLSLLILTSACSDPFALEWIAAPDTVLLYSITRPELNVDSGFDFLRRQSIRVEAPSATNGWDMVVDTDGASMFLLPPGALGIESEAAILEMPGAEFDVIEEAPREDDERYVTDDPVRVQIGVLYVIRTRRQVSTFGQLCNHYAKLVPVSVDIAEQSLTFLYDTNRLCNSRKLQPDITN